MVHMRKKGVSNRCWATISLSSREVRLGVYYSKVGVGLRKCDSRRNYNICSAITIGLLLLARNVYTTLT